MMTGRGFMAVTERFVSSADYVLRVEREYTNAIQHGDKDFKRSMESWQFYWGLDGEKGLGQWPAEAISQLVREGRHIATYNLVRPIVDNIAGGIMKAPFGIDYSPVDDDISSLTHAVKDLLYTDKELTDWRIHELALIIGGLIYRGDMEMYINREYHKDGNIGLRCLLPGMITYDPYWKTPRSKDCRKAWKSSFLTPRQMMEYFKEKKDDIKIAALKKKFGNGLIKALAEYQELYGDEYGENHGVYPYWHDEEIWGSQYRVIEFYHMEKETRKVEYCITEDDQKVYLPESLLNADPAEKIAWYNANVPDWHPDQVYEDEEEQDVQYLTTICPSLSHDLVLAHGPTEIQCGRLQFFPWSATRINGECSGIVESIKDSQRTVNYWESLLTHKIQTDGGGGSQFIDPDAFESESEYRRYCVERNNPRAVFKLKRGTLRNYPNGPAVATVKSTYPAEAMNHLEHIIQLMIPKLSKVSPATQGRSEHSSESGYLFRMKKLQADIEQFTIHEGLRCFWNEVAEAYMFQAIRTYGNGRSRRVVHPGTKKAFWINKKERREVNGYTIECIINDMSRLKEIRHRVTVTESDDSPSRKIEIMEVAGGLIKSMPATKVLTIQELSHVLAKQLDTFDEAQKAKLEEYHNLEMEAAAQQLKTNTATLKLQELQAQAQVEAMMQKQQSAGMGQTNQMAQSGTPLQGGQAKPEGAPGLDTIAGEQPSFQGQPQGEYEVATV